MGHLRSLARRAAYSLGLAGAWYRLRDARRSFGGEPPAIRDGDQIPVPPRSLINLVAGDVEPDAFVKSGERKLRALAAAVDRNGGDFRKFARILDFGCGCGRLARHARTFTDASLFGCDRNSALIAWCAKNLEGTFVRNGPHPPLDFPDSHFDVVYLLSVFTHWRLTTQNEWLPELRRIVRPGGLALVSFHDEDHLGLAAAGLERADLLAKGFVVCNDAAEGTNFISTFQSCDFARRQFAAHFEIVEIASSRASGLGHGLAVLCKPP